MLKKRLDELDSVTVGREECLQELNEWQERAGNPMLGVMLSREDAKWVLAVRDFELPDQAWLPNRKRYEEPGQAMQALGELLDRVELRRQGRDAWPSETWWEQRGAEVKHLQESGSPDDGLPKVQSIMEFSGN